MNTFALEVWDDEARKCTFYTVRWEDAVQNETDKFFNKYDSIPEFKTSTQELLSFVLDSIGEDHGAVNALFNRFENEVVGLPNKGKVTVGEIILKRSLLIIRKDDFFPIAATKKSFCKTILYEKQGGQENTG